MSDTSSSTSHQPDTKLKYCASYHARTLLRGNRDFALRTISQGIIQRRQSTSYVASCREATSPIPYGNRGPYKLILPAWTYSSLYGGKLVANRTEFSPPVLYTVKFAYDVYNGVLFFIGGIEEAYGTESELVAARDAANALSLYRLFENWQRRR